MSISPLAVIHPRAKIGINVQIDPFVTIDGDVSIGDRTRIRSHAHINDGTVIGKECNIHQGAIVGGDSQDLKYKGGVSKLIIGDHVTIREYCTINRSTSSEGITSIADNCLLMAYVHVAHDCEISNNVIVSNAVNIAGHVRIGEYAILGGMTAVQQFIVVGRHSYIGGGTLIRKDVPPYVRAAREPMKYMGLNKVGLMRRGFGVDDISTLEDIYRGLFVHSKNVSKAIDRIEMEYKEDPYFMEILTFVKDSPNGLIGGYSD